MNEELKEKKKMVRGLIRRFERADEFQIAEQKMLVTSIFTVTQKELILLETEEKIPSITKKDYPALYLISSLGRNKTKGMREALKLSTTIAMDCPDNYQKVLEGADITAKNMTLKNLQILAQQWNASENYVLASHHFLHYMTIELRRKKVDYQSTIDEEAQNCMKSMREKVLELSKQYKL